jgi:hypothetical protein
MADTEFLTEAEAQVALDPTIGDGTPDTAPHVVPFGSDDELDLDDALGSADDDDEVEDDDDAPIDDDI